MHSITSLDDFNKMTKEDCLLIKKIILEKQNIEELPDKFFWCANVEHINLWKTNIKSDLSKLALFMNLTYLCITSIILYKTI